MGEYWIVDAEGARVTVCRRANDKLTEVAVLEARAGVRLLSPLFPDLAIDLSDLFAPRS